MATVTGLTAERMREIEAASIIDGAIDVSGHLILTRYDGSQIDTGSALVAVPDKNLVKILSASGYTNATPSSSYPEGDSLMYLNDVQAAAGGWPFTGKWGVVRTIAYVSGDTTQTWSRVGNGVTPEYWIRGANVGGWQTWKKLALTDEVTAVDARVTTTNGNVTSVTSRVTSLEGRATTNEGNITSLGNRTTALEGKNGPVYAIQCGHGTVPNTTLTALGFGASPLSPSNGYTRGTNRITIPSAGSYIASYRYKYNGGSGAGRAFVELTVVATTDYQYSIAGDTTTFGRDSMGVSEDIGLVTSFVSLNAGAQIGANAFQSSGASRAIDGVLHIKRID